MNKVFNINLGGYPFTIDEDAYEHLSNYLNTIHRHFEQSEGYEEITSDIETRMAELFQEILAGRTIVTLSDTKKAIGIMGTPEDFGAESVEEDTPKTFYSEKTQFKPGKKLFRNPDNEIVGGVCSGIAAYLGIEDPLWVRIAFILMTISGGIGIPLYLVLWAIVPRAETASDRLAMRGEPINVSNIGKIIEEEMEHFSAKMSAFGDELKEEFGSKKKDFSKPQTKAPEVKKEKTYSEILETPLPRGFIF
ncbi:MAG: PspC domain-containing protein [Bacteroidetes bacterium]|nr:MAG: PspC domain-containing protein [Bacteroidota bacterium]